MRTLVYKRTHTGDPDVNGCFGVHDCMGRVRKWAFDAVIGVGGIGDEPEQYGIARRVNWVGIRPHKQEVGKRGPLVTFEQFVLLESSGPSFVELAPRLAAHIYGANVRATLVDGEDPEVAAILKLAMSGGPPPAPPPPRPPRRGGCR